ncbi:hypothetical protein AVEN_141086-1 [Araneus ventricosus]|uniref:Uncharacterized protein n=1 Tax=Araneus ventricosus TaxID=182803 RepID=A0A4Y2KAW7_ARAVE|nr:hypothetical protein AVEN_141086-1 [Araneus ventricosus]
MMNGHETDLEVDGSVGISNAEETVTESRKDSIAKDESALEKTSRRRAIGKTVVWKTFKSFVFLICLIFLIIQSAEFFNIYYKYPTTIVMETTMAQEFKLPAITFCFKNTCCSSITLLELSVRLQGLDPNIIIPASQTLQTHHVLFQSQTTNRVLTERNSPSQGTLGLSTPKSFHRLNGDHIVLCKKND